MNSQLAGILGGCAISFVAVAYLLRKAPVGYQDDRGFHAGDPPPEEERLNPEAAAMKYPEEALIRLGATDQLAG